MTLYLLRHGLTEANERHLYCGSSDIPLSGEGKRQIARYAAEGVYPPRGSLALFTSGMRRAAETLSLIYPLAPSVPLPDLREFDFGRFEMRSYEQLKDDPDYLAWIADENAACPGGESGEGFNRRVDGALGRFIAGMRSDALIVCHGGVVARCMADLFPCDKKNRYEWQPPAGRGYAVTIGAGKAAAYAPV